MIVSLGGIGVARQPGAFGPHPALQCSNQRLDPLLSGNVLAIAVANRLARFAWAVGAIEPYIEPGGGSNRKIEDQPHALEPALSKEIELGPESVGRISICVNRSE